MESSSNKRTPQLLLIHIDALKPGTEEVFQALEQDAARICCELKCPHPHLAFESLSRPKEVWWVNAFESHAEKQRVFDEYAKNGALMGALESIRKGREDLFSSETEFFLDYQPDLSRAPLTLAGARFFLVTATRRRPAASGSVFKAADGTYYVFKVIADPVTDPEPETKLFAVRPCWGMPAPEWIAADPEFWKANPAAQAK